jgi:hypothetical protein
MGVSEAALADAVADVEDDVVGPGGVARHAADTGEVVETEIVSDAPRDVVIGA